MEIFNRITMSRLLLFSFVLFVLQSSVVSTGIDLSDEKIKSIIVDKETAIKERRMKIKEEAKARKNISDSKSDDKNEEENVEQSSDDEVEDEHPHPYYKPDIVNKIRQSYRKYREMILVKAGKFWKGTNDPKSQTGEYPLREVRVKSFYMDMYPIITADYWAFRAKKKFVRSDAEKKGWSWVVDTYISDETREQYAMSGAKGWAAVKRAKWDTPEGPDSTLEDRWIHPITHMSWHDAKQFCEFQGKRLPTEPEWEFAARAGAINYAYPWGDNWEKKRANVWQGIWPDENKKTDGYGMTSPVDAFKPQTITGFYDLIGNVWEWTASAYRERMIESEVEPRQMAVLKGGSYVDSLHGKPNYAVRNGQRMGQKQDYTASNVGFRCARSAPHVDKKLAEEEEERRRDESEERQPKLIRKKRVEL